MKLGTPDACVACHVQLQEDTLDSPSDVEDAQHGDDLAMPESLASPLKTRPLTQAHCDATF